MFSIGEFGRPGPRLIFYDYGYDENITVHLALPVADPPGELPAPAECHVLPEIEAPPRCAAARRRASSRWSTRT